MKSARQLAVHNVSVLRMAACDPSNAIDCILHHMRMLV